MHTPMLWISSITRTNWHPSCGVQLAAENKPPTQISVRGAAQFKTRGWSHSAASSSWKRRQIPLGRESRFGGKMLKATQLLKSWRETLATCLCSKVNFFDCFGIVHVFNIVSGDIIHNGMDSDEENFRLFFYCPTRENQVSWSSKQAKVKRNLEITDARTIKELNGLCSFTTKHTKNWLPLSETTDPCQDLQFCPKAYHKYIYDHVERYSASACASVCVLKSLLPRKYYPFDGNLWLQGITTHKQGMQFRLLTCDVWFVTFKNVRKM